MEDINYLLSLHMQSKHTRTDVYLKFFGGGTCKFTWNGRAIPYIGRYGGHSWNKVGSRILDAQAVFLLSTEILASKDYKQAPHVGGSITI